MEGGVSASLLQRQRGMDGWMDRWINGERREGVKGISKNPRMGTKVFRRRRL